MIRSSRTRKPLLKYPAEDYILETKSKRKSVERLSSMKEPEEAKDVVEGSKGNLKTGLRNEKAKGTVVLRDRTNLQRESFKVDSFMKKGAEDEGEAKKKSTKSSRRAIKKEEEVEKAVSVEGSEKPLRKTASKKKLSSTKAGETTAKERNDEIGKTTRRRAATLKKSDSAAVRKKIIPEVREEKESSGDDEQVPKVDSIPTKENTREEIPTKESKSKRKAMESPASLPGENKLSKRRKTSKKVIIDPEPSSAKEETESNSKSKDQSTESSVTRNLGKRVKFRRSLSKKSEDGRKKMEAIPQRKFFKTKLGGERSERVSPLKRTVNAKRRNIGTRRDPRASISFRSRQTTLSESFAKQALKKVLRPRKQAKNYCEDSMVAKKENSSSDKKTTEDNKNVPVYKTVESNDDAIADKNKIYEFQFDSDDSNKKLPKKKRRKNITRKKTTTKRGKTLVPQKVPTELKKPEIQDTGSDAVITNSMEIVGDPPILDETPISAIGKEKISNKIEELCSGPRIVESVELKGNERINLTTTPILVKSAESISRNILKGSKQQRTMLKHALFNKSISPISKAMESFDPGSPWRPPTFVDQQFSRIKNVVQSTPQIKQCPLNRENNSQSAKKQMPSNLVSKENLETVPEILQKQSPSKAMVFAKSPRKFGTEISNVNSATSGTRIIESPRNNSGENKIVDSDRKEMDRRFGISSETTWNENFEPANISTDYSLNDKENNCPTSPKKSALKISKKSPLKSRNKSPLKIRNESPEKNRQKVISNLSSPKKCKKVFNDENSEAQAGPSKLRVADESRILRQSNLDNFLNIDEMPKSTRIKTIHGIFDDAHSTPYNSRPKKKISKNTEVENAFGFDDNDDSDIDISPIRGSFNNKKLPETSLTKGWKKPVEKNHVPAPARLLVEDIKRHLLPVRKENVKLPKVTEKIPIIENIEREENKIEKEKKNTENRQIPDAQNFTNTFDVSPEKIQPNDDDVTQVSLFADIEHPRFKKAPRYSYKRKRVGFVLSDDDEEGKGENAAEEEIHVKTKKRKISKVEKEREKQLENWAKELNHTFEEIDHFDLVVE